MSNSSLVDYVCISPHSSDPRQDVIRKITIHHMAGNLSVEQCGDVFQSREASANYGIGSDGRVGMYVEEKNRSWASDSRENDHQAVTIEVANSAVGGDWPVSDVAFAKLIDLCVDICQRNGIQRLNYTGDQTGNLTMHQFFAPTACIPTYSEVLTRNGWIRISDVDIGDEIACADLDGLKISFEEVYDKVPIKKQDTYTNNDLIATKDHRMVYALQQSKNFFKIDTYKKILNYGSQIYIPLAGVSNFDGLPLSKEMIIFLVAVQADGHYMYGSGTHEEKKYYGLEFHLSKSRKVERLIGTLEKLHMPYSKNEQSNGTIKIRIYNYDGVNIVLDICEKYLCNKCFTWDWLNLAPEQAKFFLNELLLWDGCVSSKTYTSAQSINLDIVNAISAINGVGSRVVGNCVRFRDTPYITLSQKTKRNTSGRNTEVTCVSVKTGIFLVRQNGKTFIIGNCPGPYLKERFPQIAEEVNRRLDEPEEDDEMLSYEQFKEYMAKYEAEQDAKEEPNWSVKEGHWGKAVNEGIINSGAPEGMIKRDEVIAIMGRLGLLDVHKTLTDIAETGDSHSKYADKAVAALTEAGIFTGDGNGNFGWDQCITREAVAKVIYEMMVLAGLIEK